MVDIVGPCSYRVEVDVEAEVGLGAGVGWPALGARG